MTIIFNTRDDYIAFLNDMFFGDISFHQEDFNGMDSQLPDGRCKVVFTFAPTKE